MKDILGREIKVGDIVAHGQRSGNGGDMNVKIVSDIRTREAIGWGGKSVEVEEVKVQGYTDRTWKRGEGYVDEFSISKGGWTSGDRVVVITESVSEELRNKLRGGLA